MSKIMKPNECAGSGVLLYFSMLIPSGSDSMFIFKRERDTSAVNFVNEILLIVRIF